MCKEPSIAPPSAGESAPNLYLDCCAFFADSYKIGAAVRMLGEYRILFGSGAAEGDLYMQNGAV